MFQRWIISPLMSLSLCLGLSACGEEESETDSVKQISAPFLVAADVSPTKVATFQAFELYEELQEADFLYNNKPSSSSAADEESDACIDEKFALITAQASGDTLSFGAHIDMTSCLNLSQEEGAHIEGAVFSFFFQMICPGEDLGAFSGKNFSQELDTEIECLNGSSLMNMGATFAVKGTAGDLTYEISSKLASYEGKSPSEGCNYSQVEDVVTMEDGCKSVDVSETTRMLVNGVESESEGADITEFTSAGVTYKDNDTDVWMASGTVKGRVNNWNGDVVYGEGTANPTYTFTSLEGETQDSTIAPAASSELQLTGSLNSSLRSFRQSVRQIRPACRTTPAYCTYR